MSDSEEEPLMMKRTKAGASKTAPAKPEPAKVKKEDDKPAAPPPAAKPAVKKEEDSDGEGQLGWSTMFLLCLLRFGPAQANC
jgi:hypothetical protein